MREYLGARFGFDGLESTTDEILRPCGARRTSACRCPSWPAFLQECDLVKFADMTPTLDECERALMQAERVVRTTMPPTSARRDPSATPPHAAPPTSQGAHELATVRGLLVVLGTVARSRLPWSARVLARGDALAFGPWTHLARAAGLAPVDRRRLAWIARAGWCAALVLALLAVPYIVWRMTLGADARVPRLGLPTIAAAHARARAAGAPRCATCPACSAGAALVMAVLALGRPQSVLRGETEEEKGIDIILVLDLSGSMRAVMDAPSGAVPRPAGADRGTARPASTWRRTCSSTSSRRRKTDRIGVVVFAQAGVRPVAAHARLRAHHCRSSRKIELGVIDSSKTAIGDAVGTAVARMRRSDARSKAVVLLTDGDSNEGVISPEYSAHLAQKEGVRVYTVQIGNGDDVDVQTGTDLFGQPVYQRAALPGEPGAAPQDVARDRRRVVHRHRQVRAREEHALHPRPPREDEVRVAGVDDGGPLSAPARAGGRSSSRSRRSCASSLVRRFP